MFKMQKGLGDSGQTFETDRESDYIAESLWWDLQDFGGERSQIVLDTSHLPLLVITFKSGRMTRPEFYRWTEDVEEVLGRVIGNHHGGRQRRVEMVAYEDQPEWSTCRVEVEGVTS